MPIQVVTVSDTPWEVPATRQLVGLAAHTSVVWGPLSFFSYFFSHHPTLTLFPKPFLFRADLSSPPVPVCSSLTVRSFSESRDLLIALLFWEGLVANFLHYSSQTLSVGSVSIPVLTEAYPTQS